MLPDLTVIPEGGTDVFGDDIGFVRLVQYMGTELDIVNAARVSFHKESEWKDKDWLRARHELTDGDKGLLRFLLKNRHGTPFEQGFQSMWHVRLPIFVMREWVRHRIGHSVNEESGRYVELRPDFYIPKSFRTQTGRPGAYSFEQIDDPPFTEEWRQQIRDESEGGFALYQQMLNDGIAKEQARIVLPLNLYTEIRWTANARSLMNFLSLRAAPDAMFEIKRYAEIMEAFFAEKMPTVHEAFVEAGRQSP